MKYVHAKKKLLSYMHFFLSFDHMNMLHWNFFFIHALFHFTGKYNHHAMETMLTEDSISLLLHGAVNLCSLVQVSTLNQVKSLNSSTICFWIYISDNIHKYELLLPKIYNSVGEDGRVKEATIFKVTQSNKSVNLLKT